MDDFLALTLAGRLPHHFHGQNAQFRWHWIDCGILQLVPHEPCDRSLVLSSGLHGNETAPVEITAPGFTYRHTRFAAYPLWCSSGERKTMG